MSKDFLREVSRACLSNKRSHALSVLFRSYTNANIREPSIQILVPETQTAEAGLELSNLAGKTNETTSESEMVAPSKKRKSQWEEY